MYCSVIVSVLCVSSQDLYFNKVCCLFSQIYCDCQDPKAPDISHITSKTEKFYFPIAQACRKRNYHVTITYLQDWEDCILSTIAPPEYFILGSDSVGSMLSLSEVCP